MSAHQRTIRIGAVVSALYIGAVCLLVIWPATEGPQMTALQWAGLAAVTIGIPLLVWWAVLGLILQVIEARAQLRDQRVFSSPVKSHFDLLDRLDRNNDDIRFAAIAILAQTIAIWLKLDGAIDWAWYLICIPAAFYTVIKGPLLVLSMIFQGFLGR